MCPSYQVDARGDAFHARAGSPAVGDAAGRSGHRRVALDRGARRAGPVPVVQGLPVGLPGQRRHGDVQGRVHPPPLRGPAVGAAAVALVDGLAAAVVAVRVAGAAAGQPDGPGSRAGASGSAGSRRSGEIPRFAEQTFTSWFADRAGTGPAATRGRVVLWPDTFTNHLAPEVGRAAVEVLEAAGYEVVLPAGPVCCGLTWISTGQLQVARRASSARWQVLAPQLAAGTPSWVWSRVALRCCAATRPNFCRDDPLADRAWRRRPIHSRSSSRRVGLATAAGRDGRALVQTHCHQHAVLGFDADRALMAAAGIDAERPRLGVLRARWQFRLRSGPLRRVEAPSGNGCCCRPSGRPRQSTADRGRRLQLPYPDRAWHAEARGAPGPVARRRTARTLISCERSTQEP